MTALRKGQYRDPLEVLIEKEERTCKGCVHKREVWGSGYCAKKDKAAARHCKDYKEAE